VSKTPEKAVRASIFLPAKLYEKLQAEARKLELPTSRHISAILQKSFSDRKSAKNTD